MFFVVVGVAAIEITLELRQSQRLHLLLSLHALFLGSPPLHKVRLGLELALLGLDLAQRAFVLDWSDLLLLRVLDGDQGYALRRRCWGRSGLRSERLRLGPCFAATNAQPYLVSLNIKMTRIEGRLT